MPALMVFMETRMEVRRVAIRYDSSLLTPAASLFPHVSEAAAAEDEPHSPKWIHTALLGLRCRPRAGPGGLQGPGCHAAAQAGPPQPLIFAASTQQQEPAVTTRSSSQGSRPPAWGALQPALRPGSSSSSSGTIRVNFKPEAVPSLTSMAWFYPQPCR